MSFGEIGLGDAGVDEIADVVSCPGTDSCKLGITSSMGLNRAVQERIEQMQVEDEASRRIHVKMSGCPNGCSQHHIANIGFYGASIKVGQHTIPAYVAHIGGGYGPATGGQIIYGTRLKVRLPAKRVPEAVERWLRHYQTNRTDGEEFNAFADRIGTRWTVLGGALMIGVGLAISTLGPPWPLWRRSSAPGSSRSTSRRCGWASLPSPRRAAWRSCGRPRR